MTLAEFLVSLFAIGLVGALVGYIVYVIGIYRIQRRLDQERLLWLLKHKQR